MKEKYTPTEPIKKGLQATAICGKAVFEALKPVIEPRIKKSIARTLDSIGGSK